MVEKKYNTLRFASGLFKVLAWIALIGGIIAAFITLIGAVVDGSLFAGNSGLEGSGLLGGAGGLLAGIAGFIGILFGSLVAFVVLKAISELWDIYISLEYNTRLAAYYLSAGAAAPGTQGFMAPPPIQ